MNDSENLPKQNAPNDSVERFPALVQLEYQRLDVTRQQIDLAGQQIMASDKENERTHHFHMARLTAMENTESRMMKALKMFFFAIFTFVAIVIFITMYMAFWGDENQRETALNFLKWPLAGIAGFGIIDFLRRILKRVVSQNLGN